MNDAILALMWVTASRARVTASRARSISSLPRELDGIDIVANPVEPVALPPTGYVPTAGYIYVSFLTST